MGVLLFSNHSTAYFGFLFKELTTYAASIMGFIFRYAVLYTSIKLEVQMAG